ncbi:MAG: TetR/AcrR family transcriptional regulator [Chloroflexi bacterium]|nr:TetR/AcrR family transcriptional regulator [Chloroflexota bacterium]
MTEQDTKAHILATATAVFAAHGFAKTSMNDIVKATGLSKGGVYWHFKSKDAIIQAIFDHYFAAQEIVLDTVLSSSGTATEKILQMAAISGSDLEEMTAQFPSPLEFYALAARNKQLAQDLQAYLERYQEKIGALIQQGIDEKEFRAVNSTDTAVTITAIFEGILLLWAVHPTHIDMSHQIETAVTLLLDGLHQQEQS